MVVECSIMPEPTEIRQTCIRISVGALPHTCFCDLCVRNKYCNRVNFVFNSIRMANDTFSFFVVVSVAGG